MHTDDEALELDRSVKKATRIFVLSMARLCGAFSLARWLTRRDLRILCYHGAALSDEHQFRGGLFMAQETFARRMQFLRANAYPVISLEEALRRLHEGSLPPAATVITIDDGWIGTRTIMAPELKRNNFPATLYIATYYLLKQTQIFHVAADYILWKSPCHNLRLGEIDKRLLGEYDTNRDDQRNDAVSALWKLADSLPSAQDRQSLLRSVCRAVGTDPDAFEASRVISFMSATEASELREYGIDVQLHTHRHRFPTKAYAEAEREIIENRKHLESIASNTLHHFCYPSGEYEPHQLAWMPRLGLASATTTRNGLNRSSTNRYELLRFLDSQSISDVEFAAEMSGFLELFRRCLNIIRAKR